MKELSESLQSAQQSLQQAGQKQAQNGQQDGQASESEMGQEMGSGQSGQQASGQGGQQGSQSGGKSGQANGSKGAGSGSGMGGPGRGAGGSAGPQQPLPGVKKDTLIRPELDPRGKKLQRTYMGTPDPTQDRAGYYQVAPESKRAAEASLNREDIPVGYKKQVRDYFDSIQPGSSGK